MKKRFLFINPPVLVADPYQEDLYAEAIPFGLIQIATSIAHQGNEVELLDMAGYPDVGLGKVMMPENRYATKPLGDNGSRARRDLFLYGRSMKWLRKRLARMREPDEIWVTCCISFNYEPAHEVIEICKEYFPETLIRFGGFYPSLFPDHAKKSGADYVHVGQYLPSMEVFPSLDLVEQTPPIWIFRLVLGCKYRCSFCINSFYRSEQVKDPENVADEIVKIYERYGIKIFSNWDPNIMLRADVLENFLDAMIERGSPVEIKFEMGIQPDRLNVRLAKKMQKAGVRHMTIPFESSEPLMMKRFGKPYRMDDSMNAVAMCRDMGFDTSRFHCTSVVGIRDESYRHVFRTYLGILKAGGHPTPFPLTPTPGTREYKFHHEFLDGKDLSELNGHLWPTLGSIEKIKLYDLMYQIINQPDAQKAKKLSKLLPREAKTEFDDAFDWYCEGPWQLG